MPLCSPNFLIIIISMYVEEKRGKISRTASIQFTIGIAEKSMAAAGEIFHQLSSCMLRAPGSDKTLKFHDKIAT